MSEEFLERFVLSEIGSGRVSIGPRAQSSTLEAWAHALARADVTLIVSLLEDNEIRAFGLEAEPDRLAENGSAFRRFPIADFGVPDEAKLRHLITGLTTEIESGKSVHIHCAGGVGRAGMVACCLLVAQGWSPPDAITHVSQIRGKPVPETQDQLELINDIANPTFHRHRTA